MVCLFVCLFQHTMTSVGTAEACVQGLLQLNISKDFCLLVTASAFKHGSASYGQSGGLDISCSLRKVLHVFPQLFLQRCSMGPLLRGQHHRTMDPHSEHRFPAPSSKLCQIYLRHCRGTLYLRAVVQRRGQRPPKGSGTNMTVEAS